jgi:peptidoglycan/xylan/chitin deacetylase (PgdA/CDA1 family)
MIYVVKNLRGQGNMIFTRLLNIFLLGLVLSVSSVGVPLKANAGPPLLLSLDVEQVTDGDALNILNLRVPATYFITGEFALQFPGVVNELSGKGTIGSHSHSHGRLTEMDTVDVHLDLLNSAQAIEAATGSAPVWFRAPFLDVNESVLSIARNLGFIYDSSESERWLQQRILKEFPISRNTTDRILLSDYDIFNTYGLDDQMALEMLKENYVVRQKSDRPFIFLLHPSIISKHAEVLHQFIEFVSLTGGECLSFDQYVQKMTAPSPPKIAIEIDTGASDLNVERTMQDILNLSISDVYFSVTDGNGDSIFDDKETENNNGHDQKNGLYDLLRRLKEEGIKIHASIPVLQNRVMARSKPERAMVNGKGEKSAEWLSPSHPQVSRHLKETINEVLNKFQFDGIHLDSLYYPSLEYDYSLAELGRFKKDEGISFSDEDATSVVPSDHYDAWVGWRSSQITNLAKNAAEAISKSGRQVELSASLITEALINFRYLEILGQDYRGLSEYLDVIAIIPKNGIDIESTFSIPKIIASSHSLIGSTSLMIGIPLGAHPDSAEVERMALIDRFMETSYSGSDGIVLPSYQELQKDDYLKANGFEIIKKIIQRTKSSQRSDTKLLGPTFPPVSKETAVSFKKTETSSRKGGQEVGKPVSVPYRSNNVLITSLFVLTVSILFIALYVYARGAVNKPKVKLDLEKTAILDWQNLDKLISGGEITGRIVHSVARQLRNYDPVDTSRYRVALLIDKVIKEGGKISVNKLVDADMNLPGWHVLAKSHLNEALMHGFFTRNGDILEVTEQGELELVSMKEKGFDPGHWIFVEQRLHENLLVNCPHCKAENVVHWYWTNFFCSSCGHDTMFKNCGTVLRTHHSLVGLDQHKYS